MTDPIAIRYCIQCPIPTQYQTTQMISLDYVSTFELGPFSANSYILNLIRSYTIILQVGILKFEADADEAGAGEANNVLMPQGMGRS
jgi:hypothetical protein